MSSYVGDENEQPTEPTEQGDYGWGVGNRKDAEPFDTGQLGDGTPYDLIFGQHPHSRQDNNIYARFKDGTIEGFDGHRLCCKIEIFEENYLKVSNLSGNQVRKICGLKIWLDGVLAFDGAGGRTCEHAMSKARKFMERLEDTPPYFRYWRASWWKENEGRKVYWRGTPAIIEALLVGQACVILRCVDGLFPLRPYEQEDVAKRARLKREGDELAEFMTDDPPDERQRQLVKVDIWDPGIWWYREEVRGMNEDQDA